ncbi:MAG: response regulator [Proteobacteria bacterium]|nr:response regulator [Pseudomonadota bacterium]
MPELKQKRQTRVLVVDDDPNEMKSLVIGLKLEGFNAIGTSSGADALDALDRQAYSVVLIDLMMPKMNGLQLARTVKSAHPNTIALLMSAYHLSPVQLARANTGVVGFVPKPYCFEELVRFIHLKLYPNDIETNMTSVPPSVTTDNGLHYPFDVSSIGNSSDSVPPIPNPQYRKAD